MAMTLEQSTQYAESLARSIWEKHYRTEAPDWEPMSGDLYGLLSQIDNMVTGISHLSAQARVRVTDSREAFEQAHGKVYGPYPPDNLPDGRWRLWQEAIDFATRLSQGAQGEALPEFLKDPVNVHALMLRGAIAVPSIRSMVDLRGEVPNDEDAQLARIAELQEQIAERAAVPDEMPDMRSFITDSYVGDTSVLETACWNEGWNAYREAMLAKAKLPAHFQPPEGARVVDHSHCMCEECCNGVIHANYCAVHNEPAMPKGDCDCDAANKWHPIESAPRDGRRILVFAERDGYEPITIASYVLDSRGENGIWAMPGPRSIPTQWHLLPAAPTLAGKEGAK